MEPLLPSIVKTNERERELYNCLHEIFKVNMCQTAQLHALAALTLQETPYFLIRLRIYLNRGRYIHLRENIFRRKGLNPSLPPAGQNV